MVVDLFCFAVGSVLLGIATHNTMLGCAAWVFAVGFWRNR